MTLKSTLHRAHRLDRQPAAWMALLSLLCALLFAGLAVPIPQASADDGEVTVSIDDSTVIVTDDSGYSITLTISNGTGSDLEAGTLTLKTNASHVFMSRTDIQDWAQNDSSIPAPDTLGSVDVPQIDAGESTSVTIDVDADDDVLQSITAWGPKPLRVDYSTDSTDTISVCTFLTRSQDGLQTEQTPAMSITVVMPLTGSGREVNEDAIDELLAGGSTTSVTTLVGDTQTAQRQAALLNAHDGLQAVADPTYLASSDTPLTVDAVMQPGGFDITAYAQIDDTEAYESAGITTDDWNADAAATTYANTVNTSSDNDNDNSSDTDTSSNTSTDSNTDTGTDTTDDADDTSDSDATDDSTTDSDQESQISTIAWQGEAQWTMQALTTAKQQGYDVVIASDGFSDESDGTVHTGKYEVSTDAGTVTVLAAQSVLTGLAQGEATSSSASGEQTEAGRLARFIAQSAFYQMEQPYTARNLLVCLDADTDTDSVDALMSLIEQSSWLELTDLQTLIDTDAYLTGDDASQIVPSDAALDSDTADSLQQALSTLAENTANITQLATSILVDDDSDDTDESDESSSAYDISSENSVDEWINSLYAAGREFALHALGNDATVRSLMLEGANTLTDSLLSAVSILPSETMTVVSETASMPVTVRNNLPYAISINVSSITDSSQIITSREESVTVSSLSETQVTFTIRVAASGTTTAHLTLVDRNGATFGDEQSTTITSNLRISDMSGFIIIALAVVLGLFGFWRQFHRTKDPDE